MSAVFKDRLNKLICGYSQIHEIPLDIISLIDSSLKVENAFNAKLICFRQFEVYLDEFLSKVIEKGEQK